MSIFELPYPDFSAGSSPEDSVDVPATPAPKQETKRRRLTAEETRILCQYYELNPKPSVQQRADVAKKLNMPARNIQVWFQNRRAKMRKFPDDPLSNERMIQIPINYPGPPILPKMVSMMPILRTTSIQSLDVPKDITKDLNSLHLQSSPQSLQNSPHMSSVTLETLNNSIDYALSVPSSDQIPTLHPSSVFESSFLPQFVWSETNESPELLTLNLNRKKSFDQLMLEDLEDISIDSKRRKSY